MSIPLIYQDAFTQLKLINAEDVAETFQVKRTERIYIPYSEIISYIKYMTNKTGHKMDVLADNRNWIITDMLHKTSRYIVDLALERKVKIIAIGHIPLWKQEVNLGKRNNQNFVNIPYYKLIKLIMYKAEEYGMNVICQNESYTSKCSFLDSEELCFHEKYIGERIYRGLFRSSKGILINADVQSAYNIIRKVDPTFSFKETMKGVAVSGLVPKRLSVSQLLSN